MDAVDAFIGKVLENIVNPIILLIGMGAFLLFVFGVVTFIANAENEEKRATGQQHMIWGLLGMVIIFGAFAIVGIIAKTIGVDNPIKDLQ
jgi:uncharacterized membrane protein YidH (DUF202 family)